jgi:predicted nucleotidyltransferase
MMVGEFDALAILKGGGCSSANVLLRHREHATTRELHEKSGDFMLNPHFDEKRGSFHGGWRFASFSRTIIREGAGTNMGKTEIVERIRARAEAIKALGATALYIYGSRVRGEERLDSDLDVFVDFDPEKFGFVELVELENTLSRELGLNVQLGAHDALHPLIKSKIEREAVRVF